MNLTRNAKKGHKQHIQVFVRVRPLNTAEHEGRSFTIVETPSNREVILHERPHGKHSKKFTFDGVFSPHSKQIDVYNVVTKPLVEEVLSGYNCTVFAYGQTGTGKTFTMEGVCDDPSKPWQTDNTAGLVPRTLSHLFDELCVLEVQEYVVRVSFLEIYNEELIDLLSSTHDSSKIRLYEDSNKKGTIIIHGLEEVIVRDKAEVYKILQKGSEKRQTAATLMNANSSRSHTVFSITVHIKENTDHGEEVLKIGKINLVDLAGSENVGRSGSSDKRAREAGSINQSLLTLGRVITALVERAPHIPYRESKLTRLLQESLGGRMKTSIIATISPASINLEETLSTLDYAHRAKNIMNRPEINQKLFKTTLLQEYTAEIERLKKDLLATRERIGVYLAQENYNEMQNLIQYQMKEIEEKANHIKGIQGEVVKREQLFQELERKKSEQLAELEHTKAELEETANTLTVHASQLQEVEREREEQKHLVEQHVTTERSLLSQAKSLLNVADTATGDVSRLHDKLRRQNEIEVRNSENSQRFRNNFAKDIEDLQDDLEGGREDFDRFVETVKHEIREQTNSCAKGINEGVEYVSEALLQTHGTKVNVINSAINSTYTTSEDWTEREEKNVEELSAKKRKLLISLSTELVPRLREVIENETGKQVRDLNEAVLKAWDGIVDSIRNRGNDVLNNHSEDIERAISFFEETKESVERVIEREQSAAGKHEAFSQMMDSTLDTFNELRMESKEYHTAGFQTLDEISEVCNDVREQATNAYYMNTESDTGLRERLVEDIESTREHTSSQLEKCWTVADESVIRGHALVDKLEGHLAELSENIETHGSSVESSMKEFRKVLVEDKEVLSKSVADVHDIVRDAATKHSNLMETYQTESLKKSEDMISELDCKLGTNESREISEKLNIICDRVNKFFAEDLQNDLPTGNTPVKKDFKYPRQFHATSPHDKILRRLRNASERNELSSNGTPLRTYSSRKSSVEPCLKAQY